MDTIRNYIKVNLDMFYWGSVAGAGQLAAIMKLKEMGLNPTACFFAGAGVYILLRTTFFSVTKKND